LPRPKGAKHGVGEIGQQLSWFRGQEKELSATPQVDIVQENVTVPKEVRPVNAVFMWVLPYFVTVGG